MHRLAVVLALALAVTAACGGETNEPATPPAAEPRQAAPADAFLERIAAHCGQAFEGRIAANEPADPNDPFAGQRLVMHVRACSDDELMIPFHVGADRSRTWILTRTETGLRLKHDHRHEDGTDDVLTMYGGDTATPGTERRQAFPVDEFSKDLFRRQNRAVSLTNVWAMEIEPEQTFVYELARPGRLFRVEFDLTRPVAVPPAPWGH
jgi:hypothetical protein